MYQKIHSEAHSGLSSGLLFPVKESYM